MLEIDFSLVPMTSEDHRMVQEEVNRRVENDEIPPAERSVNGRVILLNPDPVQTIHQISDDLRPRLRRVMMPAQEGSNHLSADQIFHNISDSDERLYLIILELQSEFRSFSSFLDYLPRLRRDYPELSVFLSGSLLHLREKLGEVISEGKATLVLDYPQRKEPVEFTDEEDFKKRISTREQEISLATPFFTEIRLNLDDSGRPVTMTLLTLRKLQSVLGHGEPQTVEVGRGRKERMIIIDLPLRIIQDFRFRQDRGLEFLGVVIQGSPVQSRHFGDEKLEFRWVPMKAIDAFLRRNAMGGEERIEMKYVSIMRVNTLTGQISFIMREDQQQISLDGASKMGFRKVLKGKPIQGFELPEAEQNGTLISFDQFIQPSTTSALNDPMQEAVKAHFYHKLIGEEVEHTRKSEIYAQRLLVAGVGPLAAQTLKLLRRFGLERVIDEESFYYLCDTPEEIPTYSETPERYNEHFNSLITLMRNMAYGQPSERIRISDIAYNLPISTEWVDTGLASFPKVTNQELEAVYHEMQMLLNFITHEFRRNFDIQKEDMVFFQKIQNCRDAGLLAKWLAEFKRGAYGKMLTENQHPDVLFFANDEEKKENDQRYFFPSLSCAELFTNQQNKDLFSNFDYDFSVFLEEQLALAIHHAREEGNLHPKAEDLGSYFAMKVEEAKTELGDLNDSLAAADDSGSEIYQKMLKEEEETYRQQFEEFENDQERVDNQLKETTVKFDVLVGELKSQLDRRGTPESEFFAPEPGNPEALEERILTGASRTENRLQGNLHSGYANMMEEVNTWLQHLARFSAQLRRFHQFHHAWQTAKEQLHAAGLVPTWKEKLQGRFQFVQRMKAMERDHHTKRVDSQVQNHKNEIGQVDSQINKFGQQIQHTLATLKHYMATAQSRVDRLGKLDSSVDPAQIVAQAEMLRKVLIEISKNAHTLSVRSKGVQENMEKTRIRKMRHMEHFYQLRVEESVLKAVAENSEPTLPMPPKSSNSPPSEEEALRLKLEWDKHTNNLEVVRNDLVGTVKKVEEMLLAVKGQAAELHRFKEKHESLVRMTARKKRLRDSANGLSERREIMETEMADLPDRVKNYFMPARKKLLIELFIPELERKISMFGKAQTFLVELMSLSYEPLKNIYLDHAIFRRFHARQFLRGGAYAPDQASPLHHGMHNVQAALRMTLRAFQHNYKRHNLRGAERLAIPQLSYQSSREIMASVENMATSSGPHQFDYLILPPTTPLMEGLNMMIRKDRLFHGVPQLVMVFITKFDGNLLRRDDSVREAYFKALKHNVVINVDGHIVVDNPRSIAMRLLQESLGCCIDIPDIEEPSGVASDAVD